MHRTHTWPSQLKSQHGVRRGSRNHMLSGEPPATDDYWEGESQASLGMWPVGSYPCSSGQSCAHAYTGSTMWTQLIWKRTDTRSWEGTEWGGEEKNWRRGERFGCMQFSKIYTYIYIYICSSYICKISNSRNLLIQKITDQNKCVSMGVRKHCIWILSTPNSKGYGTLSSLGLLS